MTRKPIELSARQQTHIDLLNSGNQEMQRKNAQAVYEAFLKLPPLPDVIEHAMSGNGDSAAEEAPLRLTTPYGPEHALLVGSVKIISKDDESTIKLSASVLGSDLRDKLLAKCELVFYSHMAGSEKFISASTILYCSRTKGSEGLGLGTGFMLCLDPAMESIIRSQRTFFAGAKEVRVEIIDGAYPLTSQTKRNGWTSEHAQAAGFEAGDTNTYHKRYQVAELQSASRTWTVARNR